MHAAELLSYFSYMVTNVVNIQPVLFHQFCECEFLFCCYKPGFGCFPICERSCHVLQEKIILCFAYVYTPFNFKTKAKDGSIVILN